MRLDGIEQLVQRRARWPLYTKPDKSLPYCACMTAGPAASCGCATPVSAGLTRPRKAAPVTVETLEPHLETEAKECIQHHICLLRQVGSLHKDILRQVSDQEWRRRSVMLSCGASVPAGSARTSRLRSLADLQLVRLNEAGPKRLHLLHQPLKQRLVCALRVADLQAANKNKLSLSSSKPLRRAGSMYDGRDHTSSRLYLPGGQSKALRRHVPKWRP